MLETKVLHNRSKEKGLASLEAVLLSGIYVMLFSFSIGFFGVIHTAIVNSIATRQYAFDTFRNRTNLIFHRSRPNLRPSDNASYRVFGFRMHTTINQDVRNLEFVAPARNIAITPSFNESFGSNQEHNVRVSGSTTAPGRPEPLSINPVWIKTAYGICLNTACGGSR